MVVNKLEEFKVYQVSLDLFDFVVSDMQDLTEHRDTMRLRSQQIAASDSICANMEEGSGRWSTKEYVQFLVIARGSATEVKGRYRRLRHWLPLDVVDERCSQCDEIIGGLTNTIRTLKSRN
jgi:four helix bundle protein